MDEFILFTYVCVFLLGAAAVSPIAHKLGEKSVRRKFNAEFKRKLNGEFKMPAVRAEKSCFRVLEITKPDAVLNAEIIISKEDL